MFLLRLILANLRIRIVIAFLLFGQPPPLVEFGIATLALLDILPNKLLHAASSLLIILLYVDFDAFEPGISHDALGVIIVPCHLFQKFRYQDISMTPLLLNATQFSIDTPIFCDAIFAMSDDCCDALARGPYARGSIKTASDIIDFPVYYFTVPTDAMTFSFSIRAARLLMLPLAIVFHFH